jgi:hypothetical protein
LIAILASAASCGVIGGYVLQSNSIQLEVKEPLEILSYPEQISLFPGESKEINVQVENLAAINYSVTLKLNLNDTEYQSQYVVISSENYTILPGKQDLTASLSVSASAPPKNLLLTVSIKREGEQLPEETPTPSQTLEDSLSPSLLLLAAGSRWAAGNGSSALFISWKDNYAAHYYSDGSEWGPWPSEQDMENQSLSVLLALEQAGFKVDSVGDIPESLADYDLVVINAYWAVEPKHDELVRDYVFNGGNAVILAGVPCYFEVECKNWWPGNTLLPEWLGGGYYVNAGGNASICVNNPLSAGLEVGDNVFGTMGFSAAGVNSPTTNGQIVAQWDSGLAFAFTNQYGQGRTYYQAAF